MRRAHQVSPSLLRAKHTLFFRDSCRGVCAPGRRAPDGCDPIDTHGPETAAADVAPVPELGITSDALLMPVPYFISLFSNYLIFMYVYQTSLSCLSLA